MWIVHTLGDGNWRPMRFLTALTYVGLVTLLGCSAPESAPSEPEAASVDSDLSGGGTECVVDTMFVKKGFLADLSAAVGPSFIKDYGPSYYKHVEIPKTLDAALPTTDEFGESVGTLLGFEFFPEELPAGAKGTPRRLATIGGNPVVDPKLSFAKSRYAAAKALFDAMTRATETTENHVVPPSHVYDQSWTKVTRGSAAGRIVCVKTTYPRTTSTDYTCTFSDVERNMVQAYNTKDTNGHCATR